MTIAGWLESGLLVWLSISLARYRLVFGKLQKRQWKSLGNGIILTVVFWPVAVWRCTRT